MGVRPSPRHARCCLALASATFGFALTLLTLLGSEPGVDESRKLQPPTIVSDESFPSLSGLLANVSCDRVQRIFGDTIPTVVHWTSKSHMVQQKHRASLQSWRRVLGDDVVYMFWDDKSVEDLLKTHYPEVLRRFWKLRNGLMRSDIARLAIVHAVGGIYADLDVQLLADIRPLLRHRSAVWSQEPLEHTGLIYNRERLVSNALFAARAGHGFLGHLLKAWPAWFDKKWRFHRAALRNPFDAIHVTGPGMLNSFFDSFEASTSLTPEEKRDRNTTLVVDPDVFQPFADGPHIFPIARSRCLAKNARLTSVQLRVCREMQQRNFTAKPLPTNSLAVHWFMHTGYGQPADSNGAVPVTQLLPIVECNLHPVN